MAVDSSFDTLFQNLKLDDPWLPPKPWESVPSESGRVSSTAIPTSSSSQCSFYDISSVQEESLVRLAIYALQGFQSALLSIQKLSESFCSCPADRSANRIPSLWNRSLSTHALGKMLKSIGSTGSMVLLLHKFVDYFTSLSFNGIRVEKLKDDLDPAQNQNHGNENMEACPARSLVNQAFAVAVGKVLQGYISAISTVNASALLRRSGNKVNLLPNAILDLGNLTSIVHSELTLLEVYLHTEEMRTQIEALGNICCLYDSASWSSVTFLEDSVTKAAEAFSKFPRGGNLLTYLYQQLLVADPVHKALLKFLFRRSLEPYCSFIQSWIYEAKINDPYGEFVIEYQGNLTTFSRDKAGILVDFPFASVRVRDGISIPCFLKDSTIPLLRAGQQLQVVLKLLELCKYITTGEYTFEDVLPGCSGFTTNDVFYAFPLSFNAKEIEDKVNSRKKFYRTMLEKLEHVMKNFEIKFHQGAAKVNINSAGSIDTQPSFTFGERRISSAAGERSPQDEDSDVSSMAECLSDPLESSECLSMDSSEEQDDCVESTELVDGSSTLQLNYLSALRFSSISFADGCAQKPFQTDKPHYVGCNHLETEDTAEVSDHLLDHRHMEIMSRDDSRTSSQLMKPSKPWIFNMHYADQDPRLGWPVGGLLENPLGKWMCRTEAGLNNSAGDEDNNTFYFDISKESGSTNRLPYCLSNGAGFDSEIVAKRCSSSNSFILQCWNANTPSNVLSMNPMLTRNIFLNHVSKAGSLAPPKISKVFPYFEFSSAEDPLTSYSSWFSTSPEDHSRLANFDASDVQPMDACLVKQDSQSDDTKDKVKIFFDGSLNVKDASVESVDADLKNARGGSGWESLLQTHLRTTNEAIPNHGCASDAVFEIPLDFIISKCILQEILLQYNYISSLTIKLLEEGFDLQEHLLTLRRYHFMEIADWADLFIRSLWHHKWYFMEANQRIPEIQGLLESSIQRSSCEQDMNKDRLYIYVKDSSVSPISSATIGVHSFNFIGLGYRVDWPISIILNPRALGIYAEIFSFLIQVKLAVMSLTDLWCLMKEFGHIYNQPSQQYGVPWSHFNLLTKLRHQVQHFVSTLQQYVLSQLSDVSWCRFMYSLEHQVKDMIDLESVHMAYLSDSLHICFLSDETQSTSNIIRGILQCALDFHSCLVDTRAADHKIVTDNLLQINNTQLLSIKRKFEKCMKELYSHYLKSPKHGEFGLSRFWSYLNYNEYYSDTFSKEMPLYGLSV